MSFQRRAIQQMRAQHVLHVDRGVIVLNKPPGLVCQGGQEPAEEGTERAQSPFTELLGDLKENLNLNTIPYAVHRLDKPTTGALILARTNAVARDLSQQFQARAVEKTYLALVRGGRKSFPGQSGEIRDFLQFIDGRASIATAQEGKSAATDWELIGSSTNSPISLVRLRLLTGLKHQLRVHMAHSLRAPIVGDNLHSHSKLDKSVHSVTQIPEDRLFLHASHVSFFRYRKSGPNKRFRFGITAPLPKDFLKVCSDLRIPLDQDDIEGGLFIDGKQSEKHTSLLM